MSLVTERTDLDNIDSAIGQPVVSPVSNTVLDRLKQIEANSSPSSSNFTPTNSTNVNSMKADLDTIVTNTSPSSSNFTSTNSTNVNSIKTDLDTIKTNTTNSASTPYFIKTNIFPMGLVQTTLTRSSTLTAYAIGQVINGNGVTSFLPLLTAAADNILHILGVKLYSSNGSASTKLVPIIFILDIGSNSVSYADYSTFSLTSVQYATFNPMVFYPTINTSLNANYSVETPLVSQYQKIYNTNKIVIGIIAGNAYVPITSEYITVEVCYELL